MVFFCTLAYECRVGVVNDILISLAVYYDEIADTVAFVTFRE